jgi:hypothetical protein
MEIQTIEELLVRNNDASDLDQNIPSININENK